jgi:molybdenum cofactor biosynthesis enzyme MoaA
MRRTIHWWDQLHKIQIDLTSHCNAACAACVRNVNGGETKTELSLTHFDLDVFKRLASVDTKGAYIRHMSWNGNWGDPLMHPDIIEMVNIWTTYHPETNIAIATNGALRSTKFWREFAEALKNASFHKVDFAMDGMADTHKLYRRKTSHAKLSENIKAFTDAGGNGVVYMTMFEHNKHQVAEVREHARSLGVRMFKARGSFTGDREMRVQGMNEAGTKFLPYGEADYTMKAWYPTDNQDRFTENDKQIDQEAVYFPENDKPNTNLKDSSLYGHINENFKEIFPAYQKSKCPWQDEGEIQIDPWGVVWPCCHTSLWGGGREGGMGTYTVDTDLAPGDDGIPDRVLRENNLHDRPLNEIVQGGFFSNKMNQVIADASWGVCRNNCGICKD